MKSVKVKEEIVDEYDKDYCVDILFYKEFGQSDIDIHKLVGYKTIELIGDGKYKIKTYKICE